QPSDAVGVQGEGTAAAQSFNTFPMLNVTRIVRRNVLLVIRIVQAGPFFLLCIPPDQLLALTPGSAVRTRRGAVVNNAAIVRPGESPAVTEEIFRIPLVGPVVIVFRKHAAVDPGSTSG